jgi:hypothetical protein
VLRAWLNRGVWELLVKWTGWTAADTTWEQLEDFKVQFPHVELADELFVDGGGGGNVVDAFVGCSTARCQYSRRANARRPSSASPTIKLR